MGVAGYSEMARMLGLNDVADKYAAIAKKMAVKWVQERLKTGKVKRKSKKVKIVYEQKIKKYQVKNTHL